MNIFCIASIEEYLKSLNQRLHDLRVPGTVHGAEHSTSSKEEAPHRACGLTGRDVGPLLELMKSFKAQ